jgi:hypothetical protein
MQRLIKKCPECQKQTMEGEMQPIPTEFDLPFPLPKIHTYGYMPFIMQKYHQYIIYICMNCGYLQVFLR